MVSQSFLEMRRRNAAHIVQVVRETPGLSRADVAKVCDLAKSTVSSIVDELVQSRLLEESGSKTSIRGRRPVGLVFNPVARVSIGISIDSDRIETALCDLDGNVLATRRKHHQWGAGADSPVSIVTSALEGLLEGCSIESRAVVGLGFAVPGPVSAVATSAVNGVALELKSLCLGILNKFEFHCRVVFDSNANMAAIAESRLGAAKNSQEALVVRLGTEIRSALLKNRRLIRGTKGLAGSIGHIAIPGNDAICTCGKCGCINSLAAPDAIVAKCQSLGIEVQIIDDVFAAALSGDTQCRQVLEMAGEAVGYGISAAINIIAPSDVIVTGRLVEAGNLVIEPLSAALLKYASRDNLANCNLVFSTVAEYSEAIGASLSPFHHENFLAALVTSVDDFKHELTKGEDHQDLPLVIV